jgi:hypothetical protein
MLMGLLILMVVLHVLFFMPFGGDNSFEKLKRKDLVDFFLLNFP